MSDKSTLKYNIDILMRFSYQVGKCMGRVEGEGVGVKGGGVEINPHES